MFHTHVQTLLSLIRRAKLRRKERTTERRLLLETGKRATIMLSYDSQLLLPSGDSCPVFKDTRTVN